MAAPVAPAAVSPLSVLAPDERRTVIATINAHLPPGDAVVLLTALAGSPEEVARLPLAVRARTQEVLLDAFPDGANVVVLSRLGLAALETTGDWVDAARERLERLDSMDAALDTVRAWQRDGLERLDRLFDGRDDLAR